MFLEKADWECLSGGLDVYVGELTVGYSSWHRFYSHVYAQIRLHLRDELSHTVSSCVVSRLLH